MEYRRELARLAGMPPLEFMRGFFCEDSKKTPGCPDYAISWATLKPDIIHVLLNHSDCDGEIDWEDCEPLADRLQELLDLMAEEDTYWRVDTKQFINGLRSAASRKENVIFH